MKKTKELNGLEAVIYEAEVPRDLFSNLGDPNPIHPYAKGMALTISTHRQTTDQLVQCFKDYYQTLLYGLTGENPSKDHIRVKSKLPPYRKVMDLVSCRTPLMVIGIHTYSKRDISTGKGSYGNYGFQHPHIFVYGVHHNLPAQLRSKEVEHLTKLFQRHIKATRKVNLANHPVKIDPVGYGQNLHNDIVSPTLLYKYLSIPNEDPSRECWINYIAGKGEEERNPLTYVYKEVNQ